MKYDATFFTNGNIAVFCDGEQIPELQEKGVPVMFAKFLESKGYDPAEFLLRLPAGNATLHKGSQGWGWRFEKDVPGSSHYIGCLHANCPECTGIGTKKDGSACVHMISCPCPKCVSRR